MMLVVVCRVRCRSLFVGFWSLFDVGGVLLFGGYCLVAQCCVLIVVRCVLCVVVRRLMLVV